MTTQLPNGYEAVKVPEGAYDFCFDADGDLHFAVKEKSVPEEYDFEVLPGSYAILGRADELTEEQVRRIVRKEIAVGDTREDWWREYYDYLADQFYLGTALESFGSLLASLHLEPHTTIILKKENV